MTKLKGREVKDDQTCHHMEVFGLPMLTYNLNSCYVFTHTHTHTPYQPQLSNQRSTSACFAVMETGSVHHKWVQRNPEQGAFINTLTRTSLLWYRPACLWKQRTNVYRRQQEQIALSWAGTSPHSSQISSPRCASAQHREVPAEHTSKCGHTEQPLYHHFQPFSGEKLLPKCSWEFNIHLWEADV